MKYLEKEEQRTHHIYITSHITYKKYITKQKEITMAWMTLEQLTISTKKNKKTQLLVRKGYIEQLIIMLP